MPRHIIREPEYLVRFYNSGNSLDHVVENKEKVLNLLCRIPIKFKIYRIEKKAIANNIHEFTEKEC